MPIDEARLQNLLDRTEVHDVVVRYALGLDLKDWEMYRSVFAGQVEIDLTELTPGTPPGYTTYDCDDWVERVRQGIHGYQGTQHVNTNFTITIRGDEADCISYIHAQHRLPNEHGGPLWTITATICEV